MSTQYYPPQPQGYNQPPYPTGPPQSYNQPPYPLQDTPPQLFPQQQYPQQAPPPQQNWQPNPPQAGGFHNHPPQNSWDPQQIWNEYNGPSNSSSNDGASRDPFGNPQAQQGADGERGLGATVLGGGAGAFLGHETHKGPLATVAGLAIGAIAANAFEHHEKKKKEERRERREYDDGYRAGESRGFGSRGIYDDEYERESEYQDDYYRPHHYHHHHDQPREIEDEYVDRETYYDDEYEEPRRHHHHHHGGDYDDEYSERYYDRRNDY